MHEASRLILPLSLSGRRKPCTGDLRERQTFYLWMRWNGYHRLTPSCLRRAQGCHTLRLQSPASLCRLSFRTFRVQDIVCAKTSDGVVGGAARTALSSGSYFKLTHYRNVLPVCVCLEPAEKLKPIPIRHVDVRKDQVHFVVAKPGEGFRATLPSGSSVCCSTRRKMFRKAAESSTTRTSIALSPGEPRTPCGPG